MMLMSRVVLIGRRSLMKDRISAIVMEVVKDQEVLMNMLLIIRLDMIGKSWMKSSLMIKVNATK